MVKQTGMKRIKVRCNCGCGVTLYLAAFGDNEIAIGTEENNRVPYEDFSGIIIDKDHLIKIIQNIKDDPEQR